MAGRVRHGKNHLNSLIEIARSSLVLTISGSQRQTVDHLDQLYAPDFAVANPAATVNGASISIDSAIDLIIKVTEVKVWSADAQKTGRHPVLIIDDKVETIDGHDYMSVNFYEDAGDFPTRYATMNIDVRLFVLLNNIPKYPRR
jgi:hypothetical protein